MAHKDEKSGVYLIRHTSGFVYVGSSREIKKRWSAHKYTLRNGSHRNKKLQSAFNSDGIGSLKLEILELVDDEKQRAEIEEFYIKKYMSENCCFNLYTKASIFGESAPYQPSEKIKKAMALIGEIRSDGRPHVPYSAAKAAGIHFVTIYCALKRQKEKQAETPDLHQEAK